MRLKHVKGATEKIMASPYVITDAKKYQGSFKKIFNNENPLHLEIGTGKGSFLIEMARKNPDINFIGVEKYDSVLVRAINKIEEEWIPNLRFISMDANEIESVFCHEIDMIYLNFSDPWPKARHERRRLTSINFLKKYDAIFKADKKIIMKTDNRHLFEYSVISFVDYGYKIKDISLNLYEEDMKDNVPTEYEIKFQTLGFPIYKIEVYR